MMNRKGSPFLRGMFPLWALVGLVISGCAGGMTSEALRQVTFKGGFSDIIAHPERHTGEVALLGGRVIEVANQNGQSELVVLQLGLDSRARPRPLDNSQGRFIVRTATFLDPALYGKGRLVTVVGKVVGKQTRPIDRMPYTYPVLEPIEIRRWQDSYPGASGIQFGVGIGASF